MITVRRFPDPGNTRRGLEMETGRVPYRIPGIPPAAGLHVR